MGGIRATRDNELIQINTAGKLRLLVAPVLIFISLPFEPKLLLHFNDLA